MTRYRFDQIAENSTAKKKPEESDRNRYVGLEHLDPGTLKVTRWGAEVTPKGDKLLMKKGDVLFGRRRAYQKKVGIAPFDGIFSAHGMVLRPKADVVDPMFFPFFISSDIFLDEAIRVSVGSLSPTANWKDLRTLEFDLPSPGKQRELAGILSEAESLKGHYRKLLTTCDDVVKSQFVEMNEEDREDGGRWRKIPFDEFAEFDTCMTTDYERYADSPHIGIDSIASNTGELSNYRTVAEDAVKSGKYIFDERHVIYSKIRPALNKVALPNFSGLCSADAYPLLPKEGVCTREFLAQILRSDYFLSYIIPLSNRSRMPKVNKEQIRKFAFMLPPLELQQEFTDFAASVDKSKFAVQQALDELNATTKKILNQELGLGDV